MNDAERIYPGPGPEPVGETPVAGNPAFVSACMSVVSGDAAALGWRLGNSVLTHSGIWGFVFRVDYQTKSQTQNSKVVNRYICWSAETDDEVAGTAAMSGRNLKPL